MESPLSLQQPPPAWSASIGAPSQLAEANFKFLEGGQKGERIARLQQQVSPKGWATAEKGLLDPTS